MITSKIHTSFDIKYNQQVCNLKKKYFLFYSLIPFIIIDLGDVDYI